MKFIEVISEGFWSFLFIFIAGLSATFYSAYQQYEAIKSDRALNDLQQKNINYTIGSGHCTFEYIRRGVGLVSAIYSSSDYPMFDVEYVVIDAKKLLQASTLRGSKRYIKESNYRPLMSKVYERPSIKSHKIIDGDIILTPSDDFSYQIITTSYRHSTTIQYSIVRVQPDGRYYHAYKIFDTTDKNNFVEIAQGKNDIVTEEEYIKHFPYKQSIVIN